MPQQSSYYHLYTPENHPVIFTCRRDFKAGMSLIAICAMMFPEITILTFELMSNHIHIALYGPEQSAYAFFNMFRIFLGRWLRKSGQPSDLSNFKCNLKPLESPDSVRNVISYSNRNGFLVHPDTTPFTYPWGANAYFFNPEIKKRYEMESSPMTMTYRRKVTHSRKADKIYGLRMLDGYACPLSFCDIGQAEKLYRNAAGYFYEISRNIESLRTLANEIGERIFYNDDELFRVVCQIGNDRYGQNKPSLLPAQAKLDLARTMHYDYNATRKQIARILKLDIEIINQMFPVIKS